MDLVKIKFAETNTMQIFVHFESNRNTLQLPSIQFKQNFFVCSCCFFYVKYLIDFFALKSPKYRAAWLPPPQLRWICLHIFIS